MRTYFVLSILSEVVEGSYVKLEFARLREFAKARAETDKVGLCYRDSKTH